jgi:hypothetical protein
MDYQKHRSLRHIRLKTAKRPNHPKSANITIHKRDTRHQQTFDTHDYQRILAAYGTSPTTLRDGNNNHITLPLYKAIKVFKDTKSTRRMHIKITGTHAMTNQARLIRTLETTGTLAKQHLRNLTPQDLLSLLQTAVNTTTNKYALARITSKINTILHKQIGLSSKNDTILKYPYSDQINRKELAHRIKKDIINRADIRKGAKTYLASTLRIVETNHPSITQQLTNYRDCCKNWVIANPPKCLGPPHCNHETETTTNDDGTTTTTTKLVHHQCELRDMPGPAGIIGRMSGSMIIKPPYQQNENTVLTKLCQFARTTLTIKNHTDKTARLNSNDTVLLFNENGKTDFAFHIHKLVKLVTTKLATARTPTTTAKALNTIHRLARNRRKKAWNNDNRTRTLPHSLQKLLTKALGVTTQYDTTPLLAATHIPNHTAKAKTHKALGALPPTTIAKTGVYLAMRDDGKNNYQQLRTAILNTKSHSKTYIIVEHHEPNTDFGRLLTHPNVTPLANWPTNSFRFQDPITGLPTKPNELPITIYTVKHQTDDDTSTHDFEALNDWTRNNLAAPLKNAKHQSYHFPTPTDEQQTKNLLTKFNITMKLTQARKLTRFPELEKTKKKGKLNHSTHLNTIRRIELTNILARLGVKDPEQTMDNIIRDTITPDDDKPSHQHSNTLSLAKRQLKNMVVTNLDKNTPNLYTECPMVYLARIREEICDSPNFKEVTDHTRTEVMDMMKANYTIKGLTKFAAWARGEIPMDYILPKQKAPKKKQRLVTTYCKHPAKKLFKICGKMLNWVFRQLPNSHEHFTLHRLNNLKNRLNAARTKLNTQPYTPSNQTSNQCTHTLATPGSKQPSPGSAAKQTNYHSTEPPADKSAPEPSTRAS